jgi:ElaB/YqjD/DUF883 family membrane-anchored ribosome-binding protein
MRSTLVTTVAIVVSLAWQLPVVFAADLPACATEYGELMVSHWLTVDSLHQTERLLYYRNELGSKSESARRFEEQKKAVDQTERDLDEAYREYGSLFKSQSKEGVEQLSNTLRKIFQAVSRNDKQVHDLLTELGRKSAGDVFQASPISRDAMKPAWDTSTIDERFRPKRILFGSTGHVGDNRILPLDFDFGSGVYTFIVPMSAPSKLDIPTPPAGKLDDVHQWMHDHHIGHH